MVSKRREGVCGSQEKRGRKEFWQVRSRLMGESSGFVNSARSQNVWTRWRCRRCVNNIPAGLRGKYRQVVAARTGESSTGSSTSSGEETRKAKSQEAKIKELRAKLEHYEKKDGEGAQGGQGLPRRRESGMVEEWEMDVEDENESRKKLDDQRRKLQKDLRDVEKLSCASKEAQNSLKNDLQQQLQEVEQRRHDLMPEHQITQNTKHTGKKRNLQKESAAAQQEMRKIREDIDRNEERFRQLSDKVDKNKMADAERQRNSRDCRQEEKEEAVMHPKQVTTAWRRCCNRLSPWERIEWRPCSEESEETWELLQ